MHKALSIDRSVKLLFFLKYIPLSSANSLRRGRRENA